MNSSLTENPYWYDGEINQKSRTFNTTKRLNSTAQDMIENAKWNLGGQIKSVYSIDEEATPEKFYKYERETLVYGSNGATCNDGACPRATSWTGKVALIYPSDYGFATGNSVRSTCLGTSLVNYSTNDCHTNNWIHLVSVDQWTLTPASLQRYIAFGIHSTGSITTTTANARVSTAKAVMPSVYLKSDVKITGGNGTNSNPYILG